MKIHRRSRKQFEDPRRCRLLLELLEPRHMLAGFPVITEFMAKNDGFLEDGDGNTPDWIEIQNTGDEPVDLAGYRLTDAPGNLARWVFPHVLLDPGEYLVLFASGRDEANYVDAAGNLHTNFALSAEGEYLALIGPDGAMHTQFGSAQSDFPKQLANVSHGVGQRHEFVDGSNDAAYLVPLNDAIDSVWRDSSFAALDHGFALGTTAMGFDTAGESRFSLASEVTTTLPPKSHAVYARMEFDVGDVSIVDKLTLQMKYDNGFVAYLNGTRVAEANAPSSPSWFSAAEGELRPDRDALESVDFDITEFIPQLTNGTNVLAIHGLNHLSDREDFLLVPRLVGVVNDPDAKAGYMPMPSPGAPNAAVAELFSDALFEAPRASIEGGFFEAPIDVQLATANPAARIRYTRDGSLPTLDNGIVYRGPIEVNTTTTLRAATFKEGHLPSESITHSYIFPRDVIRQPAELSGLPTRWGTLRADYEMDPAIVDNVAYRDEILDGLRDIRTMSIVMDDDDLFGSHGIYSNPGERGNSWERPVSVEIMDTQGNVAAKANAGLRIHGNSSRSNVKKSFRLSFRGEFGATHLDYPLFPDASDGRLENLVLHAGDSQTDAQLIRNTFARDTARDMGKIESHASYVHLYLNGLYWGLYNPFERPDEQFAEQYFGGNDDDYLSAHSSDPYSASAHNDLIQFIDSKLSDPDGLEQLEKRIDLDSLMDFTLIVQYMSGRGEYRLIGNREGDTNLRFFVWDMNEGGMNSIRGVSGGPFGLVLRRLLRHPDLQMRFADRAHKHLFNGGALTEEAAAKRWLDRANEIRSAVIAESARWGDPNRYTRDIQWQQELNQLVEQYFPRRTQGMIDGLRRSGMYPVIQSPEFSRHGGPVQSGFSLSINHENDQGIILYTVDGSDPRLSGGDVSPSAITYSDTPFAIRENSVIKARVLRDEVWSALNEAEFTIGDTDNIDQVDPPLGDANLDGVFDQLDIVRVLQRNKYLTNDMASWDEGDWTGDGVFNQLDLVAALQLDVRATRF